MTNAPGTSQSILFSLQRIESITFRRVADQRSYATDPFSIDALLRVELTSKPNEAENGRSVRVSETIGGDALAFRVARIPVD